MFRKAVVGQDAQKAAAMQALGAGMVLFLFWYTKPTHIHHGQAGNQR
jgi:hypothetical protein